MYKNIFSEKFDKTYQIFIIIIFIKLLILFLIYLSNPVFYLEDDTNRYLKPAYNILENYKFGYFEDDNFIYETKSLPFYSIFLSMLFLIFKSNLFVVILQSILITSSSFYLSIKLFKNFNSKLVFVILFNTDLLIFYYSSVFLSESITLLLINFLLIFFLEKKFKIVNSFFLYLILLVLIFTKPTFIYIYIFVIPFLILKSYKHLIFLPLFIIVLTLLTSYWSERNFKIIGLDSFSSQKIQTFYNWSIVPFNNSLKNIDNYELSQNLPKPNDYKLMQSRIISTITDHPLKFSIFTFKKFLNIFLNRSEHKIYKLFGNEYKIGINHILNDFKFTLDYIYYLSYLFSHFLLLLLFLFCFYNLYYSDRNLFFFFIVLILYITILPSISTDTYARFRIPIMPIIYYVIARVFEGGKIIKRNEV